MESEPTSLWAVVPLVVLILGAFVLVWRGLGAKSHNKGNEGNSMPGIEGFGGDGGGTD